MGGLELWKLISKQLAKPTPNPKMPYGYSDFIGYPVSPVLFDPDLVGWGGVKGVYLGMVAILHYYHQVGQKGF